MTPGLPPRTPWRVDFPDVVIHTTVPIRDAHPGYAAAKAGDAEAAWKLALHLLDPEAIISLEHIVSGKDVILLPITALEATGFNAIPDAMAKVLGQELNWPVSSGGVVQNNRVGHTRARAFNRLVTPAEFEGPVAGGANYIIVDDHVGLGGTLANLKGYIETHGSHVSAMTTLTESRDARHIALRPDTLEMLRERHGQGLEDFWRGHFGHGLEGFTDLEARILCREPSLDAIRGRVAQAAVEARGRGLRPAVR